MEIRPPTQNTLPKNIGALKKEKKAGSSGFSAALDDKTQILVQTSSFELCLKVVFEGKESSGVF